MKILFISGLYPPRAKGGAELSTHLIARGLVKLGHEVTVITESFDSAQDKGRGTRDGEYEGVKVFYRDISLTAKPLMEKRYARKQAKKLGGIIEELGEFDVVHAHDFRSAQILSEVGLDNVVATVRDYAQVCGTTHNIQEDGNRCHCTIRDLLKTTRIREAAVWRKPFRLWQYRYNIGYRKSSFKQIKNHIYISHAQLDEVKEQQDLAGINTAVIYNPVPDEYLNDRVRKATSGQVLYVGRVEEYKGVLLLLTAWKNVAKNMPNAILIIVGEGAQRGDYEDLISKSGLQYRVKFVGRVEWDRMQKTYDEAEVVVSPHMWSEPFGRTVVEAMARGKIVVAANSGGPGEIIMNEKTGLKFKPGSLEDLEATLTQALNMADIDKREMGGAARNWTMDNLKEEGIAEKYQDFYMEFKK